MTAYYYLTSSLPSLRIGDPCDLSFADFVFAVKNNLTKVDQRASCVMRRYYDLQNLRRIWEKRSVDEKLGEALDRRGNLDENMLEEALLTEQGLPDYVYDFLDRYERNSERLAHFPHLVSLYFREEIEAADGFLKEYLTFEYEMRLVMTGLRAKQLSRDLTGELQYEDPHNEIVRQLLAQKDATYYEPPNRYKELKDLFAHNAENGLALHRSLYQYQFDYVEDLMGIDFFGLARVLGFMAQLILVEKWMELDQKQGLEIVDRITKEAS